MFPSTRAKERMSSKIFLGGREIPLPIRDFVLTAKTEKVCICPSARAPCKLK